MKPIIIEFENFGPYRGQFSVDFTEFEKGRIFLICGDTGAGKTTILDAICFALYGRGSGKLRTDIGWMRNKNATNSERTRVNLVFEVNGKKYRFERVLKFGRTKFSEEDCCYENVNGTWKPMDSNIGRKYMNQKAEELTGLTYEQFCQVIILPQGQFEKFLIANSADKEKILATLFKADRWQWVTDDILRQSREEENKLALIWEKAKNVLESYNVSTIDQLDKQIEKDRAYLKSAESDLEKILIKENEAREKYENSLSDEKDFQELDRWIKICEELENEKSAMQELKNSLILAEEADKIAAYYSEKKKTGEILKNSEVELKSVQEENEKCAKKLESIEQTLEEHFKMEKEVEYAGERYKKLESIREIYSRIRDIESEMIKVSNLERKASNKLSKAEKLSEEVRNRLMDARKFAAECGREYDRIFNLYCESVSGILAERLDEGNPCPVCGSTNHPKPAVLSGESISEEILRKTAEEFKKAGNQVSNLEKEAKDANDTVSEAEQVYKNISIEEKVLATAYNECLSKKEPGIETAVDLENEIIQLKKIEDDYQTKLQEYRENLEKLKIEKATISEKLRIKRNENLDNIEKYKNAEKKWEDSLKSSSFNDECEFTVAIADEGEIKRRNNQILSYESKRRNAIEQVNLYRDKIGKKERTEPKKLKVEYEILKKSREVAEKSIVLNAEKIRHAQREYQEVSSMMEEFHCKMTIVDRKRKFGEMLRGSSGVGIQRYVLGVMLNSVTAEANRLLEKVHSGRYRLYRSDESTLGVKKKGLELEVHDKYNNERRSVNTLSGGERFLVALSLAIGLSSVVQSQGSGIKMEAMFVDEGFGSLDQNSVFDALDVMSCIKGSSIIGIISHVEILKENIQNKIEVKKSENGSTLKVETQ